jgi:hypothetical protein
MCLSLIILQEYYLTGTYVISNHTGCPGVVSTWANEFAIDVSEGVMFRLR